MTTLSQQVTRLRNAERGRRRGGPWTVRRSERLVMLRCCANKRMSLMIDALAIDNARLVIRNDDLRAEIRSGAARERHYVRALEAMCFLLSVFPCASAAIGNPARRDSENLTRPERAAETERR